MGSIEYIIDQLRSFREDSIRDPESLREFWPKLSEIERRLSTEEKWTVIEQFCMAGIDLNDDDIIEACLVRLNKQFPNSKRVKLLNIMALCERSGDYDEAIRLYNEMIEEDETNAGARKRKIAVLISQDAWKELCELYMLEQDHQKAIFCMEELLLSHPLSHIYHTRLAEMYYTMNTHESLEQARSYYSQALKLNESNVRALHGLHLTLKRLLAGNKLTAQQRKDFEKLDSWSITTVNNIYDKDGSLDVAKYMKLTT